VPFRRNSGRTGRLTTLVLFGGGYFRLNWINDMIAVIALPQIRSYGGSSFNLLWPGFPFIFKVLELHIRMQGHSSVQRRLEIGQGIVLVQQRLSKLNGSDDLQSIDF
jgi:hypothetical protein